MKMNKQIFFLVGLIGALAFTGCRKDFEEINTNPNEPTAVSTGFLLTSAQKATMDRVYDSFWGSRRGMQTAQYWSSNQYSNESRYQYRDATANNAWASFYAGPLQDLQTIIDLNSGDNAGDYAGYGDNANQIAVAKILQAWIYQHLTDAFGDIPMSQALQGVSNTTPAYDSQASVYASLITMLDEAMDGMTSGAGPQGDQIYGGNMDQWTKLANSLKLRVAMRMSDVNAEAAQTAAEAALSSGMIIAGNEDNALFAYLSGAPNNNPINEDYKTRNDFAASNTMVDYLTSLNDPRVGVYYAEAVNGGGYIGEVYGLSEANAAITMNDDVSQRGTAILAADFPGILFDAAQTHFLAAEAAERGWTSILSAEEHYNAAIALNMNFWGITDEAAIADYTTQESVAYATAEGDWKTKIGRQKWVALYMQGYEGWAEYRRLDFGLLNPCADGVLAGDGNVPARMWYPLDEQTLNGANWSAATDAGATDLLETKLWWDVN